MATDQQNQDAANGPEGAAQPATSPEGSAAAPVAGVPPFLKRVIATSCVLAVLVSGAVATRDLGAAAVFFCVSAWVIAYLMLWIPLSAWLLAPNASGRGWMLLTLGCVKMGLLAAGIVALRTSFPHGMTHNQSLALIGGLSICLVVTTMKAIGAKLMNRDLETGRATAAPRARRPSALGGNA